MCGHVGVAGNIFNQERKAFKFLLHLDYLRGPHSTGIGVVQEDDNMFTLKSLGAPAMLYQKYGKDFTDDELVIPRVKVMIGHNRFATIGAKTDDNAHPFIHGNILGAHNGTLTTQNKLERIRDFDVDSEAIFESINRIGVKDTVSKLHGAWALVWYDKATSTMNFIRNDERSLWGAWNKLGDSFYWASEKWMMEAAAGRANVDLQEPYKFEENVHHKINLAKKDLRTIDLEVGEKMLGFTQPVVAYNSQYWKGYGEKHARNETKGTNAPFTGGSSLSVLQKLQKDWVGSSIDFEVWAEHETKTGMKYLYGESDVLPSNVHVRIFNPLNERYDEWKKSTGYYTGTIRTVLVNMMDNDKREYYVVLDPETISKEIFPMQTTSFRNTKVIDH